MNVRTRARRPSAEPWGQAIGERFRWLRRGRLRVAYLYESPDSSTFRYRAFNMVDALNRRSERVSAAWFFLDEWEELGERLGMVDALVFCRCRYSFRLDALVTLARAHQIDVIFDVDDLVVDPGMVPLVAHTLAETSDTVWDYWYAYVGRLHAALQLCDRVIVTTNALAAHVRATTGKTVHVVPNFLNRLQLAVSAVIFNSRAGAGFAFDEPLHLGYFSGTPSHANDFDIVADALVRVLDRVKEVRIRTVGYLSVKDPLARYMDRVDHHDLTDFLSLQDLVGSTEVNLIPLQSNVFTDCKSELKYFEAAAVGTVSIASPTATYREVIVDGQNGLLARAHEWEDQLMTLVEDLLQTRRQYIEIARAAQTHAVHQYSWERQVPTIEAALLPRD